MVQRKTGQIGPRFFIFFFGLLTMALGIVFLLRADLGVPPWDVLHVGLFLNFGLTIGSWSIIAGIFILTSSSLLLKEFPQIGAILNMLLLGIFIDLFMLVPFIKTPSGFLGKVILLSVGVIIIAYGMGLYISASLGAGPRDSLMLALTTITGWRISVIRGLMELVVLIVGWFLGGPVFVGTIIFTIIIGPLTGIVVPQCERFTTNILAYFKRKTPDKMKST